MSKHNERLARLQAGREANRKKYLVAEKTEIAEPYEPTWRNKLLMSEDKAMDDLIEALRRDRHACPSTDSAQTFGAAAQDRRFWSKVDRGGSDECWEWKGAKKKGYGLFKGALGSYAHRHALNGVTPLPEADLVACHRCDNRGCCNPAHLWWGTPTENRWDNISKGRDPVVMMIRFARTQRIKQAVRSHVVSHERSKNLRTMSIARVAEALGVSTYRARKVRGKKVSPGKFYHVLEETYVEPIIFGWDRLSQGKYRDASLIQYEWEFDDIVHDLGATLSGSCRPVVLSKWMDERDGSN